MYVMVQADYDRTTKLKWERNEIINNKKWFLIKGGSINYHRYVKLN